MFCTKCGAELRDDASFCTKCGTPVSIDAQKSVVSYSDSYVSTGSGDLNSYRPKKSKIIRIALIAVVAVVAVVLIVALLSKSKDTQDTPDGAYIYKREAAKPAESIKEDDYFDMTDEAWADEASDEDPPAEPDWYAEPTPLPTELPPDEPYEEPETIYEPWDIDIDSEYSLIRSACNDMDDNKENYRYYRFPDFDCYAIDGTPVIIIVHPGYKGWNCERVYYGVSAYRTLLNYDYGTVEMTYCDGRLMRYVYIDGAVYDYNCEGWSEYDKVGKEAAEDAREIREYIKERI